MSATMTKQVSIGQQPTQKSEIEAQQQKEGPLARTIEKQTAKLPSDTFLWAALGSMGVSALLQFTGKKRASLFVGEWPPVVLEDEGVQASARIVLLLDVLA